MRRTRAFFTIFAALFLVWIGQVARAQDIDHSTPAVSGYDVVSYHGPGGPQCGSGYFVAEHDGVTYLFANETNKERFISNPEKFVPAYGGFCAFGVSVGKTFYTDPKVWRVVDGKLYLNLDDGIQEKWLKDIPGHIRKADATWLKIKDKRPSEL
jgi:hypothetical protein